ncbi:hypothetical protein KL911_003321 [Ogataea haglerorum]|uniref:uncharacterized protein n=1 Tax=Ogataea haglerorum TaxID=1937702 RepID=UPI001C897B00|nr:uncharacterized protein KL911_003321 [Ogataea haglerorum]KAG7750875.1 hypothetical protein KL912_000008 [Ogataea haglerorum]KAG7752590.1 hypothetical protein KL911_003321 [Ogataea haglerorum]
MSSEKENEVLSMFFDDAFVSHDYLDALFTSSLNLNAPQLKNKSVTFASPNSLKSLQGKCLSLLTHLDYYTNELTRQFEKKLQDLHNSSSIISYASENSGGITRLEYYVEYLASSINSLNRDMDDVNVKLNNVREHPESQELIRNIQTLNLVKERIQAVLNIFETVQAVVLTSAIEEEKSNGAHQTSSLAPTGASSEEAATNVSLDTFSSSLNILEETIMEQIQKDKGLGEVNNDLLEKIQVLVDLTPFFKSLTRFYPVYADFAEFLKNENKRYLAKFNR